MFILTREASPFRPWSAPHVSFPPTTWSICTSGWPLTRIIIVDRNMSCFCSPQRQTRQGKPANIAIPVYVRAAAILLPQVHAQKRPL